MKLQSKNSLFENKQVKNTAFKITFAVQTKIGKELRIKLNEQSH